MWIIQDTLPLSGSLALRTFAVPFVMQRNIFTGSRDYGMTIFRRHCFAFHTFSLSVIAPVNQLMSGSPQCGIILSCDQRGMYWDLPKGMTLGGGRRKIIYLKTKAMKEAELKLALFLMKAGISLIPPELLDFILPVLINMEI